MSTPGKRRSTKTRWPVSRRAGAVDFGCVVGVDRVGQAEACASKGADIVVADLAELLPTMITERRFPSNRGRCARPRWNLDLLAQSESVFALSNGHIGLRGNLDEGEPYGLPGTYLNSFYETRPLPYAEAGYSYPEDGQIADRRHQRQDRAPARRRRTLRCPVRETARARTRAGPAGRHADPRRERTSPAGKRVKLRSTRLVSLAQRSVAAIEYVVEAVDEFARVTVQSELVANEDQPRPSADPRVAAVLPNPLEAVQHDAANHGACLCTEPEAAA